MARRRRRSGPDIAYTYDRDISVLLVYFPDVTYIYFGLSPKHARDFGNYQNRGSALAYLKRMRFRYFKAGTGGLMFMGNCVDVLDFPKFQRLCADATQLAQLVDRGKEIDWRAFKDLVDFPIDLAGIVSPDQPFTTFWYSEGDNVAWAYDSESDTHYFFG